MQGHVINQSNAWGALLVETNCFTCTFLSKGIVECDVQSEEWFCQSNQAYSSDEDSIFTFLGLRVGGQPAEMTGPR